MATKRMMAGDGAGVLEGVGRIRRANRTAILKAAERVFAETGFAGATMAEIAEAAGLPKANLHYYFGTKEELYQVVLARVLDLWLKPTDQIRPEADPAVALREYVRAKMVATRKHPYASKVFANEVLHGAGQIERFLSEDLRNLVMEKAVVLDGWIAEGRMAPLDTINFFFMIWAVTQHYADFDAQVRLVLGKSRLGPKDYDHITDEVTRFVLRAAGLAPQGAGNQSGQAKE